MRLYRLLLTATVLLLTTTLSGNAQTIPKGADAIEVKTDLSDSLAYERLVTSLIAEGYTVKTGDEKRRVVVTDNRPIKVSVWGARIVSSVQNGTVRLRTEGSVDLMGIHIENEPLSFKGMGTGAYKVGFNALNSFAKQFASGIPNAVITYHLPEK